MPSIPRRYAARSSPSASRASLACVPCRQRHVKCDATRPVCDRCSTEDKTCHFLDSRRGGLTRDALAERRQHRQDQFRPSQPADIVPSGPSTVGFEPPHDDSHARAISDDGYVSRSGATSSPAFFDPGSASIQDLLDHDWSAAGDHHLELYYKHFHRLHPCVLPRRILDNLREQQSYQPRLELLLSVMRSIGSLYAPSSQHIPAKITSRVTPGSDPLQNAFSVQCLLLNSIALYWCGEEESSREEMDLAITIALSISMQSRTFASIHGLGIPALEESWRRTWWQLCIVDAYYAAMLHSISPLLIRPDITTELPCEEAEYESGVCLHLSWVSWVEHFQTLTGSNSTDHARAKDDQRVRLSRICCGEPRLFVFCLSHRGLPSRVSCFGEYIRR
jgi:hypothetical protein